MRWYLANESEAETVVVAEVEERDSQWPHLWIKNIGMYELMWLRSVIHGTDFDPGLSAEQGDLLYETEDKGIGIFRVKDEFIEELVHLNPDEIDRLAEAWTQTEPMVGASASDLATIIRLLADFAAQSKSSNTHILAMYVI